jgi:hypothetical protein
MPPGFQASMARSFRIPSAPAAAAKKGDSAMSLKNIDEAKIIQQAIENYMVSLAAIGISLRLRRDFIAYAAIRKTNGNTHLNQAFDPQYIKFGDNDFWLLARNRRGEAIATYCMRHFIVDDFYDLIRSQALWFGNRLRLADPRFVVDCAIPPFGGDVVHGGGCWVREDYRGRSKQPRLSHALSHLARATALRNSPIDHDSAMIRNDPRDSAPVADRKAVSLGIEAYGFARVHRFVDGWFPPEGRNAVMHLCHLTRAEAVASLATPLAGPAAVGLQRAEFPQPALVYQHEQLVDPLTIAGEGQNQARI